MTRPLNRIVILLAFSIPFAACSTTGGVGSPTAMAIGDPSAVPAATSTTTPGPVAPSEPAASPSSPIATSAPPVLDQPWATAELIDVATGETFRIADLAGRTILLETMAIWCTSCRAQQGDVYEALERLDPERVVYVLLDVDPNETGRALAEYRERNGFTGVYAIAGRAAARALADEFGDQMLNPPSTPIVVIGTDGRVTRTDWGHKNVKTIVSLAREHGA